MSVEFLTYAALGDRLKISPAAARSLARRLRLPRTLSDDGKALVSIDLAEVSHTPHPPGNRQAGNIALLVAQIEALQEAFGLTKKYVNPFVQIKYFRPCGVTLPLSIKKTVLAGSARV